MAMQRALNHLTTKLRSLLLRETGASLVEYALLIALIALVCIGAITFFGGSASESFSRSGSTIFTP